MTASTPGSSHTERVGPRAVLPVRVAISIERKMIEDVQGALAGGKAGVAAGANKENKEKTARICEYGVQRLIQECI